RCRTRRDPWRGPHSAGSRRGGDTVRGDHSRMVEVIRKDFCMSAPLLTTDLAADCAVYGRRAKAASCVLATATSAQKDSCLRHASAGLIMGTEAILAANARDLAAAEENGLTGAQIDRLRLT